MPKYAANVIEVQHVLKEYQVEADSPVDATEKASTGETFAEFQRGAGEVVERVVQGEPVAIYP